ncbi:hypothetical protein EDB83DRAFT_2323118 [Lactarius deliciosus]|nr:hypothetical protein EDB83DRAFT_2323118 [Lactarius deliciosus]
MKRGTLLGPSSECLDGPGQKAKSWELEPVRNGQHGHTAQLSSPQRRLYVGQVAVESIEARWSVKGEREGTGRVTVRRTVREDRNCSIVVGSLVAAGQIRVEFESWSGLRRCTARPEYERVERAWRQYNPSAGEVKVLLAIREARRNAGHHAHHDGVALAFEEELFAAPPAGQKQKEVAATVSLFSLWRCCDNPNPTVVLAMHRRRSLASYSVGFCNVNHWRCIGTMYRCCITPRAGVLPHLCNTFILLSGDSEAGERVLYGNLPECWDVMVVYGHPECWRESMGMGVVMIQMIGGMSPVDGSVQWVGSEGGRLPVVRTVKMRAHTGFTQQAEVRVATGHPGQGGRHTESDYAVNQRNSRIPPAPRQFIFAQRRSTFENERAIKYKNNNNRSDRSAGTYFRVNTVTSSGHNVE